MRMQPDAAYAATRSLAFYNLILCDTRYRLIDAARLMREALGRYPDAHLRTRSVGRHTPCHRAIFLLDILAFLI
jgi:hypothetical protein